MPTINTDSEIAWDEMLNNVNNSYPVIDHQENILNIIDFSKTIVNIDSEWDLWPRQKFILKIFYNLPLDEDEKEEIKWLKNNKGLIIPENYQYINFKELVLVCGRRSSKSVIAALIATYEDYKLLNLYNPQKFYGLIPGTPIFVLHCAAESDQAESVQDYISGFVKNSKWFIPYVDKVTGGKIRFFTRFDRDNNVEKGTVRVYSLTSNSQSMPGKGAIVVILDELSRMMDTSGRLSGDSIYQALTPSVKTFKDQGKILNISSPLAKGGIFYDLYLKSQKVESMVCFQYATWEINPTLTRDDFKEDFEKNPEWAMMEYGAEFGEVLEGAFNWDKIDLMVEKGKHISTNPIKNMIYGITCDGATKNDRYGIAWGHAELRDNNKYIIIDGLKFFESKHFKDQAGNPKMEEVDLDEVDNFVISLCGKLEHVSFIAYDQGKSTASIQKLKKRNLNAIETTFTNPYKSMLYNDTETALNQERLKVYEFDDQKETMTEFGYNGSQLLIAEMKHLEKLTKGGLIKIGKSLIGKIKSDDLYDCVSNLVHILVADNPKQVARTITATPRTFRTRNWG